MNNNIFREYDIRGIVKDDFSDEVVYSIGRAFGQILVANNQTKVSTSGDIRHSTNHLKNILNNGLIDSGLKVFDMGILPTPINYFSLFHTDVKNSIQITGSHNPKEYNGFKFSMNGKPFFGQQIMEIKEIIKNKSIKEVKQKGNMQELEIIDDYIEMIQEKITINKKIRCVMDCGNSVAGIVAPKIFKKLNIDLKKIFCDINPDFPNHHPDPTVDSNLNDLVECVKKGNFDLGVAYDGDADRVVVVDENGRIIRSDILMSVFVKKIISKEDSVIFDVKCSRALESTIKSLGAKPIMYKTGHSLIKNKMIEINSKFGGEMSGHIFFNDKFYGFDDGIYASLRIIEILSSSSSSLSQLVSEIPRYYSTPEIRLDCDDDKKFKIVENIKKFYVEKYDCNLIDGVRIEFDYGWGLLRVSNTQPIIVCRFEANSEKNLDKIKHIIFDQLKKYGVIIKNEI